MRNILLVLLTFSGSPCLAASPFVALHHNADVKSPPRFYATDVRFVDPPMTRAADGKLVAFLAPAACTDAHCVAPSPASSTVQLEASERGFHPVARTARVVSAPVRWLFHFHPLRRLFGRCG